jgi:hypothetical protein
MNTSLQTIAFSVDSFEGERNNVVVIFHFSGLQESGIGLAG